MTEREAQKIKRVAAELRFLGIVDRDRVLSVAARVDVADDGSLVGLDKQGRPGVGSGPNYSMSIADVVKDLGAKSSSTSLVDSTVPPNPFLPGRNFNMTAGMLLFRTHPDLAADYASEAGFTYRDTAR